MSLTVTHPFVSAIADDPAAVTAGEVVPSNWNAAHTVSGTLPSSSITGLAASATTDTTVATNITSGTLPDARLSNTIAAGGPTGDSTHVAQITYDAHGRLTTVSSVAISGGSPTGAAGGDLGGTYPNPTVISVADITTGTLTPSHGGTGLATLTAHAVMLGEGTGNVAFATIGTAGNLLIDQGAGADPVFTAMSGDVTITAGGVATVGNTKITYAKMQNESATTLLGNPTGGAASPSEITLGLGLQFSGTTLVAPVHPGYIANNWYTPWPNVSRGAGAASVSGTTYFMPVFLATKMHMHALGIGISTLHAGGSIALGLYSNNSGATPAVNRPGNLLSNTGSISTASTGFFSAALGADQIVGPGWYWLAYQTNDITARVQSYTLDPSIGAFLGSATGANVLTNTSASIMSVWVTGTFATWIADVSGSSFTENTTTLAPVVAFQPSSVP